MKLSELIFNKNGMSIRTELPIIGEMLTEPMPYDKLSYDGFNITVTSIEPLIEDGVLVELKFKVSNTGSIKPTDNELISSKSRNISERIPQKIVMRLEEHNWPDHYARFTRQLYNPSTAPYLIRMIIKGRGSINDTDLRDLLEKQGYSKTSGGIAASINVLENVTQEVKVEGKAKNKRYIWVDK